MRFSHLLLAGTTLLSQGLDLASAASLPPHQLLAPRHDDFPKIEKYGLVRDHIDKGEITIPVPELSKYVKEADKKFSLWQIKKKGANDNDYLVKYGADLDRKTYVSEDAELADWTTGERRTEMKYQDMMPENWTAATKKDDLKDMEFVVDLYSMGGGAMKAAQKAYEKADKKKGEVLELKDGDDGWKGLFEKDGGHPLVRRMHNVCEKYTDGSKVKKVTMVPSQAHYSYAHHIVVELDH